MKPISTLTNEDKAILIHQFFPGEIEALIQKMLSLCTYIIEGQDIHRKNWDNGFLSFDFWLSQVTQVQTAILKNPDRLVKNAEYFSGKLFSGVLAIYSNHCIDIFVKDKLYHDPKFAVSFELFYGID